jgi:hypothetical protein
MKTMADEVELSHELLTSRTGRLAKAEFPCADFTREFL